MYLSMYLLKHELRKYHTESHIVEGKMWIRNASLLYQADNVSSHTVYICHSEDYISALRGKIICINRNDYIIIDSDNLEEIFENVNICIDNYMEWDLHAHDRIHEGASLQEILELASRLFQRMLCIADSICRYTAIAGLEYCRIEEVYGEKLEIGDTRSDLKTQKYMKNFYHHLHQKSSFLFSDDDGLENALLQTITAQGLFLGSLILYLDSDFPEKWEKQLFSVLYAQITLWADLHPHEDNSPKQEEFLKRIIHKESYHKEDLEKMLITMRWEPEHKKYLCLLSQSNLQDKYPLYFLYVMERNYPSCILIHDREQLLILVNTALFPWKNVLESYNQSFSNEKKQISMGVSYPFYNIFELPTHVKQAELAIAYGSRTSSGIHYCAEYMVDYIKNILVENIDQDMIDPTLREFVERDRRRHTSYTQTLYTYLLNERSLVQTAKALQIHISTLKYRLNRIHEMLNLDLDNAKERIRILLMLTWFENN